MLDGHNRLAICEKTGVPYEVRELSLPDRLEAKIWIRRNQIARRDLTDNQRAINAAGLAELESEKAKRDRSIKAGKTGGGLANELLEARQGLTLSRLIQRAMPATGSSSWTNWDMSPSPKKAPSCFSRCWRSHIPQESPSAVCGLV